MAGVYVHIPFCVKKCDYCDFVSYARPGRLGAYVDALVAEIKLTGVALPRVSADTVFFGGGTPSLLTGAQFTRILSALREAFFIAPDAEITVEVNPGTASREKLAAYREAGANRLSIGLQSADDALLAAIGRIHTYAQFLNTLEYARTAGLSNINADVMHGLPGQTIGRYLGTLGRVADLGVGHVSAYALILEEGTPLDRRVAAGEIALPDPDLVADMQDAGVEFLEKNGFRRYEISNFAKPGFCCRHNCNYWDNGEYIGVGAAAHSCLRLPDPEIGAPCWTRWENEADLDKYFAASAEHRRPAAQTQRIPRDEERFETVMLGLRRISGLDKRAFFERFGTELWDAYPDALAELSRRGWLTETQSRLALTKRGLDLQNAALQLFMR